MPNEFYFAVGSPESMHSGVWKAWTQGDEFYAAGTINTVMKLSVHRSGICRLATNVGAKVQDWDQDKDPRVAARWSIGELADSGSNYCFTLMVPSIVVPERFGLLDATKERHRRRIVWIKPAPVMWSTIVNFVRSPDDAEPEFHEDASRELLGELDLRSGGRVRAYVSRQRLSETDFNIWQSEHAKFVTDFSGPVLDGEVFGTFSVAGVSWAWPLVREMALGRSNTRGPD